MMTTCKICGITDDEVRCDLCDDCAKLTARVAKTLTENGIRTTAEAQRLAEAVLMEIHEIAVGHISI